MDTAALKAQIVTILTGDAGLTPEAVADAIVTAVRADLVVPVADPNAVVPTAEGSRDETHDSIDPTTGTLTADALAKRALDAAAVASDEADDEAAQAELDIDTAEEAGDETALAAAKDKLTKAQAKKAAAQAKLDADKATLNADGTPVDPIVSDGSHVGFPDAAIDADAGGAMVTAPDPKDTGIVDVGPQPATAGNITTTADLTGGNDTNNG